VSYIIKEILLIYLAFNIEAMAGNQNVTRFIVDWYDEIVNFDSFGFVLREPIRSF
jgi:hypothetical protein